ncbi:hypothetical protein [Streptomyces sp. NPDC047024]|uniref:WXG100-like domain-containing protein n=1 Tax=Streptomyces sp. NPDC047024 TaxID=3155476 RepID=UPI0033FFE423
MGYTLPGWLDDVLDFIGINFPNVDEDDYREMADAMRDFADKFEGHGADAHKSVERILASSHGWAVDSMEKHWAQVKAGHLDKIPELARLFADACDIVADIIFGMKTKAEAELVIMAGSLGISAGLAVVTGGLSALIGAAEVTAMRQVIKRLIDEAVDRIVDELIARVTEPVNAKLEAMIEDAVLNMVDDAFSLPPVPNGGDGAHGHHGMKLASAGGDTGLTLASSGGGRRPLHRPRRVRARGGPALHPRQRPAPGRHLPPRPRPGRLRPHPGPRRLHPALRRHAPRRPDRLRKGHGQGRQTPPGHRPGTRQGDVPPAQGNGPRRRGPGEADQDGTRRPRRDTHVPAGLRRHGATVDAGRDDPRPGPA